MNSFHSNDTFSQLPIFAINAFSRRKDTKRNKFAWHNNIINQLALVNEMAEAYEDFLSSKSLGNRPSPTLRKELRYQK